MKKPVILSILCIALISCIAQVDYNYAVLLTAEVNDAVPYITLNWQQSPQATGYYVYKKSETAASWGAPVAILSGTVTSYTDNNVDVDTAYEYRVVKHTSTTNAYGYIYSGIKYQPEDYKGKLILLIDSFFVDSLAPEILRLMKDISGDGWSVVKYNVSRTESVTNIKSIIKNEYDSDPDNVKALLLFGHIPVPYSGNINPDSHADHFGAWPADVYYADVDGIFTDVSVNNDTASHPDNINVPGDGKFDQNEIPSEVELQTGRIDLSNLPSFQQNESVLLKNYLEKNHNFRNKLISSEKRGLIDDNWSSVSQPIGSCGWRNFAPLIGANEIDTGNYFQTLSQNSYVWSYALGGGTFQSAGGIGQTSDFAVNTVKSVFTMLFGSYFGDWNNENNFLRAPLASADRALTCCWAGCPYWLFHHMALGANIGYSTRLTQNNLSLYSSNASANQVHIALMGDPTLKMDIVAPPSNINLSIIGDDHIRVTWSASSESVAGYYVYHSTEEFGKYTRISPAIISIFTYTHTQPSYGVNYYMVKAVKLEQTPSGSYYNVSEGMAGSISYTPVSIDQVEYEQEVLLTSPNPVNDILNMKFMNFRSGLCFVSLNDPAGRIIKQFRITLNAGETDYAIDRNSFNAGVYFLKVETDSGVITRRIILI